MHTVDPGFEDVNWCSAPYWSSNESSIFELMRLQDGSKAVPSAQQEKTTLEIYPSGYIRDEHRVRPEADCRKGAGLCTCLKILWDQHVNMRALFLSTEHMHCHWVPVMACVAATTKRFMETSGTRSGTRSVRTPFYKHSLQNCPTSK